jgi:hypothetical protein
LVVLVARSALVVPSAAVEAVEVVQQLQQSCLLSLVWGVVLIVWLILAIWVCLYMLGYRSSDRSESQAEFLLLLLLALILLLRDDVVLSSVARVN